MKIQAKVDASKAIRQLQQFEQALNTTMLEELSDFADELEQDTRADRDWQDDTGSAAAAITAYLAGQQDPRKNFGTAEWLQAQAIGSKRWGNPPEHYIPQIYHGQFWGAAKTARRWMVVLTSFVRYAASLEFPAMGAGGLFGASWQRGAVTFLNRTVVAIANALRKSVI